MAMVLSDGIDISGFDISLFDRTYTDTRTKTSRETGETTNVDMTFYVFVVRANKSASEIAAQPGDDVVQAAWKPVADLPNLKLPDITQTGLRDIGLL